VVSGNSGKYIADKAALALCISYIIMLHSCCFNPEISTHRDGILLLGEKTLKQFSMTLHILTKMKL
jgi:hypothetical protein